MAGFEPTLQMETAQQAAALTARPHCLIPLYFFRSARPSLSFYIPHSTVLSFLFSKKRQWQDLNLRIQRIIDFKSIALDHSATLSSLFYSFSLYSIIIFFIYITTKSQFIFFFLFITFIFFSLFYFFLLSFFLLLLFSDLQQYSWLVSSPVT